MRPWLKGEVQFNLSHTLWEGHCELTARIVLAKKGLGNHRSALTVRKPSFQNGGDMLISPIDGEWLTVDEHQHDRLTGSIERF